MPWNGSGTFTTAITFVDDTPATAEDQNTQDTDIAGGITNCLARDGQNAAAANISLGGNKLINVGAGSASTDGVNFSQLGALLPAGMVIATAGFGAPAGYLLCNGQAVSRTTFANLFATIGGEYGNGDGLTTFNVPNLIGRVIAGIDPTGTVLTTNTINNPAVPGGTGGQELVTLSTAQMPAHAHTINDPGHNHVYLETPQGVASAPGGTGFTVSGTSAVPVTTSNTGITINNTGSSAAHTNVQPTITMYYLIKT